MVRVSGKIRRILLDQGLVSPESWAAAIESGKPVLEVLLDTEGFGGAQFMSAVGSISGVAPVQLENCTPEERAVEALSRDICLQMCVVPLVRNANTLTVAVSDPFDVLLFDDLSLLSGCRVRPVLSHPAAIRACLESTFDDGSAAVEELLGEVHAGEIEVRSEEEEEVKDLDVEALAAGDDVPAVKLVNLILLRALKDRASDIHIEPGEDHMRVRYRV
ncbi:MAG: type IV pilus assembly protein PilB, partial [Bacteroidia bacterium]